MDASDYVGSVDEQRLLIRDAYLCGRAAADLDLQRHFVGSFGAGRFAKLVEAAAQEGGPIAAAFFRGWGVR